MYLQTDDQTIDDLRIFGKRDSSGVFDLYNRVHTRGGELLLKEIFRAPLSDMDMINTRSSIIRHFATNRIPFPFSASMFDMAEKYMQSVEEANRQGNNKSLLSEKEIANGVAALIELMQVTRSFLDSSSVSGLEAYASERESIAAILNDAAFEPVLRESGKSRLAYAAVAAYDVLFRNREQAKVNRLLKHIYYLDVLLSVAAVANERGFIFPEAQAGGGAALDTGRRLSSGIEIPGSQ